MQMKTEIEEIVLAMYIYTPIYVLYIIYIPWHRWLIELLLCADMGGFFSINTYKGQGQLTHTLSHHIYLSEFSTAKCLLY